MKLDCDVLLSTSAFKFILRRYTTERLLLKHMCQAGIRTLNPKPCVNPKLQTLNPQP
jgi:hypothetical protein